MASDATISCARSEAHFRRAVLLNDTSHDRHHGCTLVARTLNELAGRHRIEFSARSPVHHDWLSDPDLLRKMEAASLIIINGEGTIHHDRPAGRRLLAAGAWGRQRGIATALINATWQNNSEDCVEQLRQFAFVSVRETASRDELARHGVHAHLAPDLALYSSDAKPSPRTDLGFTDSVLPEVAAAIARLGCEAGGRYISLLHGRTSIRDWVQSFRKFGGLADTSPKNMVIAVSSSMLERHLQRETADQFVDRVSRCRLLITGRFHAVIVGLATKTPMLAIASNTHKIEATMRDAGLEVFRMAEPRTIDSALIDRASRWTPREEIALAEYLAKSRELIEDMFYRVARL